MKPADREYLEALIETAIALLDQIDGDSDCEPDSDDEPWIAGSNTDRESDMSDWEVEEPDGFYPAGSWLAGGADAA
jgi:hypothetical protein